MKLLRVQRVADRIADDILARHPRHESIGETLACRICAQALDTALARRRRLDEQERRSR